MFQFNTCKAIKCNVIKTFVYRNCINVIPSDPSCKDGNCTPVNRSLSDQ